MGVTLDLFVADESIKSPFLRRSFLEEIIQGWGYLSHKLYLTEAEIKILSPNTDGEITLGTSKDLSESDRAE